MNSKEKTLKTIVPITSKNSASVQYRGKQVCISIQQQNIQHKDNNIYRLNNIFNLTTLLSKSADKLQ